MLRSGKPRVEGIAQQSRQGSGSEISTKQLRDLGCGRAVGRYTLLRRIATGGMAEVYVAHSRGISGFEKKVAIKKILPQHAHNERFIDMLVDEAKITVSLTHPNIAQVYELGLEGQDSYFIVMEYVDGRPLNKLMQRVDERGIMTIPVEHAAHVMSEVAKGLEHAHKQKDQRGNPLSIVHRDISPQNVLISYSGDVKLIDFGIARAEGRIAQTSHGVIKGKLRYLAPEIAMGEEPDHRADIFCCGIVLFEMLTGEAMFAPRSDLEAIEMASEARVRSPRSRNPNVPQDLDEIVMRALRRDRKDRFQSAKDLHSELRRFLNLHHPSSVGSELGDFMQQMFGAEIVEEKKLDQLAETVAQQSMDEEAPEEPTFAGDPGEELAKSLGDVRKAYKQLVTRVGISSEPGTTREPSNREGRVKLVGADGGRSMGVVLDDSKMRPPIDRSGSNIKFPVTMPPQHREGAEHGPEPVVLEAQGAFADFRESREPTVRAENPFLPGSASILPTIRGPAASDVAAPGVRSWSVEDEADPAEETADRSEDRSDDRSEDSVAERSEDSLLPIPRRRTRSMNAEDARSPVIAEPPSWKPPSRERSGGLRIEESKNTKWGYIFAFVAVVVAGASFIIAGLFDPKDRTIVIAPKNEQAEKETLTLDPFVVSPEDGPKPDDKPVEKTDEPEETDEEAVADEEGEDEPEEAVVPARAPRPGTLVVNSRPQSIVIVDGKKKGVTPLKLRLSAGRHKVTLKGPDGEQKTSVKVISPGKTTTVVHRW